MTKGRYCIHVFIMHLNQLFLQSVVIPGLTRNLVFFYSRLYLFSFLAGGSVTV